MIKGMKLKGIHRKSRYIVLLVISGILLSLTLLAKLNMEEPISRPLLGKDFEDAAAPFDRFRFLKGVSLVSFDGNHERLSMKADKVIHRNRISSFLPVTFYNLKEIYTSNLRIDSYPGEQLLQGKPNLLNLLFKHISDGLSPMMRFPSLSKDDLNNLNAESDILTRAVIERLFLTVNLRKEAKVTISSDMALINLRGVTFQGHFSLISSDGKNLTAPMAIWLKNSEGIYFPDGYLLRANRINQRGTKAIFIIDRNGKLLKSNRQPLQNISGLDWIDEAEVTFQNILLKAIIRHIPSLGRIFPESSLIKLQEPRGVK